MVSVATLLHLAFPSKFHFTANFTTTNNRPLFEQPRGKVYWMQKLSWKSPNSFFFNYYRPLQNSSVLPLHVLQQQCVLEASKLLRWLSLVSIGPAQLPWLEGEWKQMCVSLWERHTSGDITLGEFIKALQRGNGAAGEGGRCQQGWEGLPLKVICHLTFVNLSFDKISVSLVTGHWSLVCGS